MARVDEPFEPLWTTIWFKGNEEEDTVITPTTLPGKLVDRHHLQMRDAEVCQGVEMTDCTVEGSSLAEGSDVHLVEDRGGEWRRVPVLVGPLKGALVVDP